MSKLLCVIALMLIFSVPVLAAEAPSCEYCGEPWDTSTRVIAVLSGADGAATYHFDSAWHFYEYLKHGEIDGAPWTVLNAFVEDYASNATGSSRWIMIIDGEQHHDLSLVWTEAQFDGARKAPFVAMFAQRADAEAFQAAHGGEVIGHSEVLARFEARWAASHSAEGEEKHEETGSAAVDPHAGHNH